MKRGRGMSIGRIRKGVSVRELGRIRKGKYVQK